MDNTMNNNDYDYLGAGKSLAIAIASPMRRNTYQSNTKLSYPYRER